MSHPAFPGGVSGADPDLTERQRRVFRSLLDLHGRTGRSISSESIGRMPGIRWSSASIRGALAELEAMGLVAREHVSSGRRPNAAGYAFYVRSELTPAEIPDAVRREIAERLQRSAEDVEQLLDEASRLLSELTRQLGLAVTASLDRERLANVDLEPLGLDRALLVLGLEGGAGRTLVLELDSHLERAELEDVRAVLRARLIGLELWEARERLDTDPELVRDTAVRIVARAARTRWNGPQATALFSSGTGNIATLPEFADGRKLAPLLRVVESGPPLDRLMVQGVEGQPAVRVALDEDLALSECSLVSYPVQGRPRVAVGVLGPLRMDYARVVAVVDAVGRCIGECL